MEQIAQILEAQKQSMTMQQVLGPLIGRVDAGDRSVAEAVAQRDTGGNHGNRRRLESKGMVLPSLTPSACSMAGHICSRKGEQGFMEGDEIGGRRKGLAPRHDGEDPRATLAGSQDGRYLGGTTEGEDLQAVIAVEDSQGFP